MTPGDDPLLAAEAFVHAEGRLLERRLFATCFRDAPATGVVDALRGFQNDDGGFGHGLEPDKRCPASLPIDVEIAFQTLVTAGATDADMIERACDYLARVAAEADAGGAVPLAFPVIESYPRADHWSGWTYAPGVNPTAGLAGLLHRLGVEHPWREDATRYCWRMLDEEPPDEVHSLSELLVFLEHVPDRDRAEERARAVVERMTSASMFHLDPRAPGYGLSPLTVAPARDSRWRTHFTGAQIDAHLDHLLETQRDDGGWPVTWTPPGTASLLEWRGIVTLQAVRTLTSYGRLSAR